MKKIAFTNTRKHAVHIGNKMIMPGDTREINEVDHPDYKPPAAAEPEPSASLVEQLADASAKDAINALGALDDEQLIELDQLNNNKSKPWASLTTAIAKQQLERAQDDQLESNIDSFIDQLKTHDDEMLLELADLHADDDSLLALIQAEIDSRAAKQA